jgi:hypothetical protein
MKKILLGLIICVLIFAFSLSAQTNQNKEPKLVAQKLYAAWHLKNKKSALKIADKDAINKLFSVKWRAMKFEGCNRRDEGGFECIYRDAKIDFSLAMIVEGGVSVGGYNVTSLSFSTEE